MSHKLVYISVDHLDALKLGKGILTDKELAVRVGVYPSYIHKVKAQGRCRLATAERIAKVLGWGFVERSPAAKDGTFARVEPYELPTLEEALAAHGLEHDREEAQTIPGPREAPPATSLEQKVREFLSRAVPEKWPWYTIQDRRRFWAALKNDPVTCARIHTFERDRVCAAEVWAEALGRPLESMTRKDVKQINAIIAATPGWEEAQYPIRVGPYGKPRGFIKTGRFKRNRAI